MGKTSNGEKVGSWKAYNCSGEIALDINYKSRSEYFVNYFYNDSEIMHRVFVKNDTITSFLALGSNGLEIIASEKGKPHSLYLEELCDCNNLHNL